MNVIYIKAVKVRGVSNKGSLAGTVTLIFCNAKTKTEDPTSTMHACRMQPPTKNKQSYKQTNKQEAHEP